MCTIRQNCYSTSNKSSPALYQGGLLILIQLGEHMFSSCSNTIGYGFDKVGVLI